MKLSSWITRVTGILIVLSAFVVGAAVPASASTKIPTGYVLGSVEWCNYTAYKGVDLPMSTGQGSLHLRARHNMSNGRDGICAYVTDDSVGSHWTTVKVRAYGWSTSAWDAGTYSTYAGAIGLHAVPCFDLVEGTVTINGVTGTRDIYPSLWCT